MPELTLPVEKPEFRGELGIVMRVVAGNTVCEVISWPAARPALDSAMRDRRSRGEHILHIGPGRYWSIGALIDDGVDYRSVDISHKVVLFQLRGAQCRNVLRKGLPIDLHEDAFAEAQSATSMIDSVTVTVQRVEGGFDLYCDRSYSETLWHWLNDAALEFMPLT